MRPPAKIDRARSPPFPLLAIIIQISTAACRISPPSTVRPSLNWAGQNPSHTDMSSARSGQLRQSYVSALASEAKTGLVAGHRQSFTMATAAAVGGDIQTPSNTGDLQALDNGFVGGVLRPPAVVDPPLSTAAACHPLLNAAQQRFCRTHPMETWLMGRGAEAALRECRRVFKDQRWNCYSVSSGPAGLTHKIRPGSREASFVAAISAAAMTHALVRGCADGTLRSCRCDRHLNGRAISDFPQWKWGGCSADLRHPMRLNRRLIEASPHGRNADDDAAAGADQTQQDVVDAHNSAAGRLAVKYTRRTVCRCHGSSGSCTVKTCWKSLATLHTVGDYLFKRYRQAERVRVTQAGRDGRILVPISYTSSGHPATQERYNSVDENRAVVVAPRHRRRQSRHGGKRRTLVKPRELVYMTNATDYCRYDPAHGSLGTGGRLCSKRNHRYLCCGRGYKETTRMEATHCKCRFEWCCQVHCEVCYVKALIRTCNK